MINRPAFSRVFLTLLSMTIISLGHAHAQTSTTESQVEPEGDFHVGLPSNVRLLVFSGLIQGAGYSYQQWYEAAGLGYRWVRISKPHLENIDPDKEHYFLLDGGYEFLRTIEPGKTVDENRIGLDGTFSFRPSPHFLVSDRNRVEFRWINGIYSTTYRQKPTVERDFLLRGFRFTPYISAEAFYNGAQSSWNQEFYTAGVQYPYKHVFMVDAYYQRQHCRTCRTVNANVAGITLHFFFQVPK